MKHFACANRPFRRDALLVRHLSADGIAQFYRLVDNSKNGDVRFTTGFEALVHRWQEFLEQVALREMKLEAPRACWECGRRHSQISRFDEAAAQRAEAWRREKMHQ